MTKTDDERTMGDGFKPAPVPDNEAERLREVSILGLTKVNRREPNLNDIIRITIRAIPTKLSVKRVIQARRPRVTTSSSRGTAF